MVHSANWVPGQSGNPKGRPKGIFRDVEKLQNRIRELNGIDPFDFLTSVIKNDKEPKELRVQAANMQLPYLYSKRGATAEPPARVYLETELRLPHPDPRSIAQGRDNIVYLSNLKATGQIDQAWGDNLIADQYKILSALVDEAKIAIQGGEQGEQVIRIEGGLPTMPGLEELIMPKLNGHSLELQAIESEPPAQAPDPYSTKQESGP
jgi:hypothetical protein